MENTKKPKEKETLRKCEVCGKSTMGYSNFCMCDECWENPKVQKALFSI